MRSGSRIAAVLAYLALFVLFVMPLGPGATAEAATESAARVQWWITPVGIGGVLAVLVVAVIGLTRPPGRIDWAAVARGLGDFVFLLALLGAFRGLHMATDTVARLGAAVTPADLGGGLGAVSGRIASGALVALLSIVASAAIRLRRVRAGSGPGERDDAGAP